MENSNPERESESSVERAVKTEQVTDLFNAWHEFLLAEESAYPALFASLGHAALDFNMKLYDLGSENDEIEGAFLTIKQTLINDGRGESLRVSIVKKSGSADIDGVQVTDVLSSSRALSVGVEYSVPPGSDRAYVSDFYVDGEREFPSDDFLSDGLTVEEAAQLIDLAAQGRAQARLKRQQ